MEEWIDTYQGTGKRGFTEGTRDSYRRDLEAYAYPFLDERLGRTVSSLTPRDITRWIAWLADEQEQGRRRAEHERRKAAEKRNVPVSAVPAPKPEPLALSDASIRRIVAPVRACLATAKRQGDIRHNPADGAVIPHRPKIQEESERAKAKALSREELSMFLRVAHPDKRLMFRFVASTGVRFSEMVAVRWRDLVLDGSQRRVMVRRAIVKGREKPPKSEYGRRDIPLSVELARDLQAARTRSRYAGDDDRVFASSRGNPPNHANLMRRYLKPAAEEAGVPWAGFHSLRHTCAAMLFAQGRNIKQVQRWLGHHAPSSRSTPISTCLTRASAARSN